MQNRYKYMCIALIVVVIATVLFFTSKLNTVEEELDLSRITLEDLTEKYDNSSEIYQADISEYESDITDLKEENAELLLINEELDLTLTIIYEELERLDGEINQDRLLTYLIESLMSKDIEDAKSYFYSYWGLEDTLDDVLLDYLDDLFIYDYYEIYQDIDRDYLYVVKDGNGNEISFVYKENQFVTVLAHLDIVDNMMNGFCTALNNEDKDKMLHLMIVDDLAPTEDDLDNIFTLYSESFDLGSTTYEFDQAVNGGIKYKLTGTKGTKDVIDYVTIKFDFDTTFIYLDDYKGNDW